MTSKKIELLKQAISEIDKICNELEKEFGWELETEIKHLDLSYLKLLRALHKRVPT